MGQFDPLFDSAAQQYGVDPNTLRAVAMTESSMNPNATSKDANGNPLAMGLMQLTADTARRLGVKDPYDPAQAIPAAANLLRQNLDASGGDTKTALMMYHGGTDTSNWGPKTRVYPETVFNNLAKVTQQSLAASDPVYQALTGQGQQPAQPAQDAAPPVTQPAQATAQAAQPAPQPAPSADAPNPDNMVIDFDGAKAVMPAAQIEALKKSDEHQLSNRLAQVGVTLNTTPFPGAYRAAQDPVYQALTGPAPQQAQPAQPAQPQANPYAGMSNTDLALAGAKKSVTDLGHGAWELGADIGNKISPDLVSNQTVADLRAQTDAREQQDAALLNTVPGMAGYVGGNILSMFVPGGLAAKGLEAADMAGGANALRALVNPETYKAAAATGAVQGALRPVGTDDSRSLNMVAGAGMGMAGNALVNGLGRIAQPVTNKLDQLGSQAVQTLQDAGVPLDAAQRSGSAFLNRIKSGLSDNPLTAGGQRAFAGQQQGAYNSAVLNTIGENATAATPDVMNAAKNRIGQVFDDVASRNPITYDNQLQNALASIEQQSKTELQSGQFDIIQKKLDEVLNKAADGNGAIDGAAYQNIKTSLDRLSKGQDQGIGYWARQMRDALDDGLQRSAQPGDYEALAQARNQWRNMRQIEGAIGSDGSGNISPNKLANAMAQKANRNQSIYGNGPQTLVDLAQAGKNVLPDKMPNSGTPARILAQMAMTGGLGGGLGYLQSGDLGGAAKGLGLGVILPFAMQRMINSPGAANYLTQGMEPGIARSLLEAPSQNRLLAPMFKAAPGVWVEHRNKARGQ